MQETVATQDSRAKSDTKTRVFISYSRKDMAFADRLEAALKARGFEVLIDRAEIYAFEDWWKRIEALISGADTIVFALSPDAIASREALREIEYAASLNKRLAPVVCRRVEDSSVPEALRRLNFIFFDEADRFEDGADKLASALQTDIVWIRDHTKFGETARGWTAAGRPNGLLLRTPALEMAEYWIASRPRGAPEPTSDIRSYVTTSRQGARSAQRLRRVVIGSMFTLLVGMILGLVGWINQAAIADQWRLWTVTLPYARANVRPYGLSAAKEQALKPGASFKECAQDCPEMAVVPAGSFTMGAPPAESQEQLYASEIPQHKITFARSFAVSKYEATFGDWDACVAGGGCKGYVPNDQSWGHGRQPVINVSWDDAQQYVAWLSLVTGKTYRLLSEAEYEYAARAGTTTAYPWGNDIKLNGMPMASCDGCGSKWDKTQAAPVGSFPPNKFGLYDMVGNIFEWTEDCRHDNYNGAPADGSPWLAAQHGYCDNRQLRSAANGNPPGHLRSAARTAGPNGTRIAFVGFRVARTLDVR